MFSEKSGSRLSIVLNTTFYIYIYSSKFTEKSGSRLFYTSEYIDILIKKIERLDPDFLNK